jgi:hypothetical protein
LRIYSQLKVYTNGVIDLGSKSTAGGVDTSGKFTASVDATSGKLATDVKDASGKFMPVSMTPVVNNDNLPDCLHLKLT